ncbi:uncharacterized protein EDB93DRAFT_1080589 [Suillus bovinus]|uniref:uncharacterized protein n=1 Tax=Suillus bovinus TaxID=48563 RepID=UPI001B860DC5|nr:uncharacterized protein EDB93DRAFT_1080589 [Suillus bovinus]KAG2155223.1 hypothetical protein EDB93DRAFT_1080589 [Suillus bovinus]
MASAIANLPAEVIEAVLIVAAASGNPDSIAALSQTSKSFYELIHCCPDQHLWREIFLTTFDDPRPALKHLSTISGGHHDLQINWTQEYIERISAARYIRRAVQTTAPVSSQLEILDISASLSVVKALLSVITTSLPFPSCPPISHTILTNFPEPKSHFTPTINSPPPLLILLKDNYSAMLGSVNVTWLQDLLEIGFPPELTRTLMAKLSFNVQGRAPYQPTLTSASHWDGSEVSQLFHKLICCTGFRPIAASTPEPIPILHPRSSLYIPEEQFADARTLARRRVYDMRYLGPARMWGPFLPVRRSTTDSPESNQLEILDEDGDENEDDDDVEDEDDDFGLMHFGLMNGPRIPDMNPPIEPYELVPDYVWLASARIVVEANLGEMPTAFSTGILPYMRKMYTTCIGGSPGYWDAWVNRPREAHRFENSGKSKQGEVEGWDWAGISGIWKRCICWLDYRELLGNVPSNSQLLQLAPERFLEDHVREACRIIPIKIRITGYSEYPIPPGSTTRPLPTIHFEGESLGSDRSLNDLRKVTGTVSMIGDGAIRWSMVSTAAGTNEPEWSSEAVQIGGPGAAVGFLGMWTGAMHERPDPLGPFWAWKVA